MTTAQMENSLHTEVIRLKEHLFGFVNVHLLNTGLELGLFEELRNAGNVGLTVAELARRKKLHEPYLSVWCRCAYGCSYLDMPETERFCLAPQMATILADTQHPVYMGNVLRLFATYCSLDLLESLRDTFSEACFVLVDSTRCLAACCEVLHAASRAEARRNHVDLRLFPARGIA